MKTQAFELLGWMKGLNKQTDDSALEFDELSEALNVEIDPRGDITRRKGFNRVDSSGASDAFSSMQRWWPDVADDEAIIAVGPDSLNVHVARSLTEPFALDIVSAGAVYSAAPGTASEQDLWFTDFISLGEGDEDLYLVRNRGSEAPRKVVWTNSSTAVTVSALSKWPLDVADETTAESTDPPVYPADGFPLARFGCVKNGRAWVANVEYADGTKHPSRVHFSFALMPERWYGLDYYDFDPNDGQEITAMEPYGEGIMVFKNHSVQILTGKSLTSFARSVLDEEVGTVSPNSVAVTGSVMHFFDRDKGVWRFDGAQFVDVTEKIRDYLLDGINYEYAWRSHGFMYRGKYYLSVPWGASTVPNRMFILDTEQEDSWSEWDFGVAAHCERGGSQYGAPNGESGIHKLFDGDTDGAAAADIDAYVETGWMAPASGGAKHRIRRLEGSFADAGTNQAVDIAMYTDFSATKTFSSETVPDGAAQFIRLGGFGKDRWRYCKLKVANVDGSDFRMNSIIMRLHITQQSRGVATPND